MLVQVCANCQTHTHTEAVFLTRDNMTTKNVLAKNYLGPVPNAPRVCKTKQNKQKQQTEQQMPRWLTFLCKIEKMY